SLFIRRSVASRLVPSFPTRRSSDLPVCHTLIEIHCDFESTGVSVTTQAETTKVGIVGGGPAGLMLSHLLARAGVDNIVLEARDHETIKNTHRAGILETAAFEKLTNYCVDSRVTKIGYEHGGIDLRFDGESHRINFKELVDASVWLYPQNEVFVDLAAARARDNGDVRYQHTVTDVTDIETAKPK